MVVPRFFWFSASVALLVIAASAAFFLLAVLPTAQRHRDELNAEIARKQANDKLVMDCAEQSRRAGDDMAKHSSRFAPTPSITDVSNHYNHKLGKCIVDVQTVDKIGTAEFIMDAYEQSSVLWCSTQFIPKGSPPVQRTCMDNQDHPIDPTEADKRIDALMHE